MASPSFSVLFHAKVSGASSSGGAGDVVIPETAGGDFVKATAAARGTRRSTGITLGTYSPSQNVEIQQVGLVDYDTYNLGAGAASWVRTSSTGTPERCTPAPGDDLIGYCEADGSLHLMPGVLSSSTSITLPLSLASGGFGADVSASTGIPKAAGGSFTFVTAPSGTIVGTSDAQTLTNKTISGASNTLTVRLANDVSGTLPLANGGFGANVSGSAGIPIAAAGSFSFTTAPSGTLVGTSDSQTLTNKTLTSPTIATPTLSGASAVTSNNAKGTNTDVNPVNVQTTDATVTTLDSFTLASNTTVVVSWLVVATRSTMATAAAYSVTACFRNNAGTVAQVGTTTTTVIGEDVSGWDATADNSTTTIRLRVTGASSTTIQWSAICTRFTVIP